ncbi:MAG: hypothetical protein HN509_02315 [Halobacteriovoraceae bacterium]|jgi:hypothetical protein|nr:hypothetical protein [Halobacteriovoraceae bacterium]MBT5094213.1 hypothetical protein [Halobacteriovoraceae bacterium]
MERNSSDILKLQDLLTQEILGIFWVTKEQIKDFPRLYESMDYFMDGLLTKGSLVKEGDSSSSYPDKTFLLSEHFGAPFFIGHIEESVKKMDQHFAQFMDLVEGFKSDRKKILVIGQQGERLQSFLKKKYSKYTFQTVTYSN